MRQLIILLSCISSLALLVSCSAESGDATLGKILIPDSNPYSEAAAELGRHLFFDTRLSGQGTISCASCHDPAFAFADPRPFSEGDTGELGTLNSPSLLNVAYRSPLGWASPELQTIEEQLLGPMFGTEPIEMGMSGYEDEILARLRAEARYLPLFENAYPGQEIDLRLVRYALASYLRSLLSLNSSFDDFLGGDQGALSPAEARGSELFFSSRLGCGFCHAGPLLSTSTKTASSVSSISPYHNIGLYNLDENGAYPASAQGLIEWSGQADDMGRFRVPSLRNVARTAPYGHDGSVATLSEMIDIYEEGGRHIQSGENLGDGRQNSLRSDVLQEFELSDEEHEDLLAFLHSLSGEDDEAMGQNPWLETER